MAAVVQSTIKAHRVQKLIFCIDRDVVGSLLMMDTVPMVIREPSTCIRVEAATIITQTEIIYHTSKSNQVNRIGLGLHKKLIKTIIQASD